MLGKTLERPLDSKEIQPVNPKGNQSWIFIGRTEAEAPILWPFDIKNCLIGKDHDAGKDWRQEEKGMTENEMVGWHHWFDGCEFEQTPGVYDGQGSLVCCSPWGHKDWVTELNWTELFECKKTKQKCRYIQWIYSVEVFSRILLCSRFIYEIEVYAQMCPNVTDYYSYMNKIFCDKCYKVHRNTVGRAELFFADSFISS